MKILVIGAGAREHALCWKLSASPLCDKIFCAPGNAGIAEIAECLPFSVDDHDSLLSFARSEKIDLTVVGPEMPLVGGLADLLEGHGFSVFGPNAAAARLEGSKGFMKDLARDCHIPTARYLRTKDPSAAKAFAATLPLPIVLKSDGLASGKGVVICASLTEADKTIDDIILNHCFGKAGDEIIVEEYLEGEELSFFALSDGTHLLPFGSAQDHKRIGDGDVGANTGGMGAYSPAPIATSALEAQILETILRPTIGEMKRRGIPFKGVLFAGIMVTKDGPKLLEFNVRFGDPECQVLCLRLKSDLLTLLLAASQGTLEHVQPRWHDKAAIAVVMAAKGYPGDYQKNTLISRVDRAARNPDVAIFHAGTARNQDGDLIAVGGRVLSVCATGQRLQDAHHAAYAAIMEIDWPEGYYRHDIGWRALVGDGSE